MYFTRTDDGFRGWFAVTRTNGLLRTDIIPGDFTAIIVDSADTTSSILTVTQSNQKQGLYRFDIPASFLTSNGVGEYGVSIEVATSSPPSVTTAFSEILKVSLDDFNSLTGSVWNTTASVYDVSGTFGWMINQTYQTSSQAFFNTETIITNTDNLLYSASLTYNDVQNILTDLLTVVSATVSGANLTDMAISNVVSGVWNANSASFNLSGTMGWLQNQVYDNSITIISDTGTILNNTNDLVFSSSQIYGNTVDILTELLTVVSATVSGTTVTQDSISTIVSGVWQANDVTFNTSGTMGWLQNLIDNIRFETSSTLNNTSTIISGGIETNITNASIDLVVSGVWNANDVTFNTSGTMGYLENLIDEIKADTSYIVVSGTGGSVSGAVELASGSIATVVSGVWDAAAATFNTSGTMGWLQNQTYDNSLVVIAGNNSILSDTTTIINNTNDLAYSSSLIYGDTQNIYGELLTVVSSTVSGTALTPGSISSVVSGVWNANDVTFNTSGTMGYLENLIDDIKTDTTTLLDDSLLIISGTNQLLTDTTNLLATSSLIYNDTSQSLQILASGSVELSSATVDTVVSGVWLANSATFDMSWSMGWLQNRIGATEISASVTIDNEAVATAVWNRATASNALSGTFGYAVGTMVQNVWNEDLSVYSVSGSAGLTLQTVAGHIQEIYQILGLELGSPLTVSQTVRAVAAISQSISGDPSTSVTVTRLP